MVTLETNDVTPVCAYEFCFKGVNGLRLKQTCLQPDKTARTLPHGNVTFKACAAWDLLFLLPFAIVRAMIGARDRDVDPCHLASRSIYPVPSVPSINVDVATNTRECVAESATCRDDCAIFELNFNLLTGGKSWN